MHRILIVAIMLAVSSAALANDDIDNLQALAQTQFHDLSADLGAAVTFKPLQSAEPEGITGFDIGVDFSGTQVEHKQAWTIATGGSDVDTVPMARLRVSKGLPGDIDIGAFYSTAPNSNIKAWGAELRYALVEGGVTTPAIGLRGSYSKVSGVDKLGFHTSSIELSISKGFGPLTPYAGIGHVWISSDPDASTLLESESFGETEKFVGINIGMAVMNLAFEWNRIGDNTTYAAKLSFGF